MYYCVFTARKDGENIYMKRCMFLIKESIYTNEKKKNERNTE